MTDPKDKPASKTARLSRPLFVSMPEVPAANDDFVSDVLAVVASLAPDLKPEHLAAAEAEVRHRWGGDRPYIARRPGEGHSYRNEQIRRDYSRGERLALLERRYNLSQRRLLQIIRG